MGEPQRCDGCLAARLDRGTERYWHQGPTTDGTVVELGGI